MTRVKLVSAAGGIGESGHASDWMSNVDFEQRMHVPEAAFISTVPGSSRSLEACQSIYSQSGTYNAPQGIAYGTDNSYGDPTCTSGDLRPAHATVLKMTGTKLFVSGDFGEACTIPPAQEPTLSSAADLASDLSSQKFCSCISCLQICKSVDDLECYGGGWSCRFPSCQNPVVFGELKLYKHEKSHYGQPRKYTCLEQDCDIITKTFGDLKRHYKGKHCTKPNKEQFPCPVLWCKYSGNNGFARKDKLKSHYKNIHEGIPGPAKAGRVIKPAALRPQVSGYGGNAGKQK